MKITYLNWYKNGIVSCFWKKDPVVLCPLFWVVSKTPWQLLVVMGNVFSLPPLFSIIHFWRSKSFGYWYNLASWVRPLNIRKHIYSLTWTQNKTKDKKKKKNPLMIKGTIFPVFWTFSILLKLFGSMVLWTWRTTLPELRQQSCTAVWQGWTCLLNFDGLGNGTLNKRFGSAWFFIFLWAFITCVLFF